MNPKKFMPQHIVIKTTKSKEKNLKAVKEKQLVTNERTLIRESADFSVETLQAILECHNIFKWWKEKKTYTQNALPAR